MADTTGTRVRDARERRLVGQSELAREAGITQSALWHIEKGDRNPRPSTIRRLAEALSRISGKPIDATELWVDMGQPGQIEPGETLGGPGKRGSDGG
jgi:predicted transcriptional regulator